MRFKLIPAVFAGFMIAGIAPNSLAHEGLETERKKFSYALGLQFAQQIRQNLMSQGLSVDAAALALAVEDLIGGKGPRLSLSELQAAAKAYADVYAKERLAEGEKNDKAGKTFLAANKKKEGVVERDSGLQYKVISKGSGKQPVMGDTVVVNYRGTLLNGKEFDSSYGRGEPTTLQLENVIPGWKEALPLMKEGSKWQIYVPSELAYGVRGAGDTIGPNETLTFDIELLEVKPEE